jgi:gamma-glutamyltranspeptidase/glutathione hydrolase
MLQALSILSNWQLSALHHNSGEYLHLVIEAIKLAYADREQWYGDPTQNEIPAEALLSAAYGRLRAQLIDPDHANGKLRPGDPRDGLRSVLPLEEQFDVAAWGPGTVHVDVVDADGSMVAATPSGGWVKSSEVIPALGFPLGNRLMTFYLGPTHHPNCVAPYRRPRTTISPSLAQKNGKPWLAFGSMGGDQQDQWQLQFFLNCVVFGMSLQEAIEAPKLSSEHFPAFFAPHDHFPNRIRVEPLVGETTLRDLAARGHDIDVGPDWSEGHLLAVARDPESGILEAGCDPRSMKSDIFPACARCW